MILGALTLSAGTIGPSCGSCFGGIYTLSGVMTASDATTETWQFTYELDTTGYNGGGNVSYVGSIAAKVTSSLISASTVSNPTTGGWTSLAPNTNVNNAGCDGSGAGWVCIAWTSGSKMGVAGSGGDYKWVFSVTMAKGSLLDIGSIQANYDPANGKIMSEKIATPEGSAGELPIAISCLGLWMLWHQRKRLLQQGS